LTAPAGAGDDRGTDRPKEASHATCDSQPAWTVPRRRRGRSRGFARLACAGRGVPRPHARAGHRCAAEADPGRFQHPAGHPRLRAGRSGGELPFTGLTLGGFDVEPVTLTDFKGFSAVAFHVGTATARDGTAYNLETDLRAFRGNYVDATGTRRFGTFAFI
jgi:hypothetical protein